MGAMLRYGVTVLLKPEQPSGFPLHTFLVNIIGCLVIGWVFAWINANGEFPLINLLLVTGVLGGFTTFSSYVAEVMVLFKTGFPYKAFMYVALSNIVGIGSAGLGFELYKWQV